MTMWVRARHLHDYITVSASHVIVAIPDAMVGWRTSIFGKRVRELRFRGCFDKTTRHWTFPRWSFQTVNCLVWDLFNDFLGGELYVEAATQYDLEDLIPVDQRAPTLKRYRNRC